jgi:hypothetical protein
MEIAGNWLTGTDGVVRPFVTIEVAGHDGSRHADSFLIDTGADATAFSDAFFARLRLPTKPAPTGVAVSGVGGLTSIVLVEATLELTSTDNSISRVRGEFVVFTDPSAADYSVLGRDVLDNFDLILSRSRGPIRLLATNHYYQIVRT